MQKLDVGLLKVNIDPNHFKSSEFFSNFGNLNKLVGIDKLPLPFEIDALPSTFDLVKKHTYDSKTVKKTHKKLI